VPNVPIWKRPKKDFLNNFLEVILQKLCNTHRHDYLEKLLINNKCKFPIALHICIIIYEVWFGLNITYILFVRVTSSTIKIKMLHSFS